jgi:ATP-dependent Clp protease ATP-binding subunit ClpC
LEVTKVIQRLKARNIVLQLDEQAKDFLVSKGYDPLYGARPMRRAVERFLEDPLAESLLRGDVKPGDSVNVVKKADGEELDFVSTRPEPEQEVSEAGV